ncbi:TPA: hypothetical protein ACM245_000328 [Neisseria meningitidis]
MKKYLLLPLILPLAACLTNPNDRFFDGRRYTLHHNGAPVTTTCNGKCRLKEKT